MPRRKKHRYHYGALVPHTGNKGFKIEYQSNRLRISLETVGNVIKYREFRRLNNGEWRFTRSVWNQNNDPRNWAHVIEEFTEKVERDARKGQEYLNTKGR